MISASASLCAAPYGESQYMSLRWSDIISGAPVEKKELDPDEIKKNMLQKLHALGGD